MLLKNTGRSGIIIPIGIVTDNATKAFFNKLITKGMLYQLVGFENESFIFPSVHHSFKFCAFTMCGEDKSVKDIDFVFYIRHFEQIDEKERHFKLTNEDLLLINPNTQTCPVFRTFIDAELTKKIYRKIPILVDDKLNNDPWTVNFMTMFQMAGDSNLFYNEPREGRSLLYEAKMMHQFDHRYGTYEGATQANLNVGILPQPSLEQLQDPTYHIMPRYWVDVSEVESRLLDVWNKKWLLGFRDVTSAISIRTVIFSLFPIAGIGHKIPLLLLGHNDTRHIACFLANMNSLVLDYVARQNIGGLSLSFFIIKQLPIIVPKTYLKKDLDFITPRVLELVYTAYDLKPFAEDMGYTGVPFKWDEERRALLKAELDAYYAKLYGIGRDELRYILDPQDVYGPKFPGETFRVLKEKEIRQYDEYRTRRLVLEAWDRLFGEG